MVTDGSTYDIPHPEFCMVLQTSVIVGVPGDPGSKVPESAEWIDARHIVKVIPLTQPATDGNNGPPANGPQG